MNTEKTACDFFEACETCADWEACKGYSHDGASFACQADALAETTTLEGYSEWLKILLAPIPNGRNELTAGASLPCD